MGWFSYECPEHGEFKVSLSKREKKYPCPKPDCIHDECAPLLKVGSFQVIERLDNGAMARAVERLHNIEDIMEERDKKFTDMMAPKIEGSDEND